MYLAWRSSVVRRLVLSRVSLTMGCSRALKLFASSGKICPSCTLSLLSIMTVVVPLSGFVRTMESLLHSSSSVLLGTGLV